MLGAVQPREREVARLEGAAAGPEPLERRAAEAAADEQVARELLVLDLGAGERGVLGGLRQVHAPGRRDSLRISESSRSSRSSVESSTKRHRRGDVRVHRRDLLAHLERDGAVRGMALVAGAELDQVQRLARVELEHVADPVGEAERIRRLLGEPLAAQPLVLGAGHLERALVLAAEPGLRDLVRHVGAEVGPEPLPLAREQAVPLEVAERAVVGDDLEAVGERLEAAPRPVAAVLARRDELAQERRLLVRGQRRRPRAAPAPRPPPTPRRGAPRAAPARCRARAAARTDGPASPARRLAEPEPRRRRRRRVAALAQVLDPAPAAVGARHARDEARDDRLQLREHQLAVRARLGERVREQVQDELLVGLAARVDADVRERRGRQQPADEVERLRLHGAPVRGRRLPLRGREPLGHPGADTPSSRRAYVAKRSSIARLVGGPEARRRGGSGSRSRRSRAS